VPSNNDPQLPSELVGVRRDRPVELDDHVEVVDRGFHGERREKVVDARHMAFGGDRGILRCLPSEPPNGALVWRPEQRPVS
jgi:hypothetical protein